MLVLFGVGVNIVIGIGIGAGDGDGDVDGDGDGDGDGVILIEMIETQPQRVPLLPRGLEHAGGFGFLLRRLPEGRDADLVCQALVQTHTRGKLQNHPSANLQVTGNFFLIGR